MEAGEAAERLPRIRRAPAWVLGVVPLALVAAAIAAFALLGAPGLGDRNGVPVENLAVERTVLRPGEIELTVRNDGPDPVAIAQVSVNDAYVGFDAGERELGHLGSTRISIPYSWIEGQAYEIFVLSSTGATFTSTIDSAAETPEADGGFFGLMALLGVYVGVIPVALGMLWLPFVRRIDPRWVRFLLALTVGLLAFLGLDAIQEGVDVAAAGPQAFGGPLLVFAGALVAFLLLAAIDAHMSARQGRATAAGVTGFGLALLVAIGIGLHNLGEGLAIGSSYATGALALGAFLVVGFAVHNTTEGLAIVSPLSGEAPGLGRLAALGLVAGAPAIAGALIGAVAFSSSLAALLLGVGAGAIAQVIVQIAPSIRDQSGRALNPLSVAGLLAGIGLMYLTGLLVAI